MLSESPVWSDGPLSYGWRIGSGFTLTGACIIPESGSSMSLPGVVVRSGVVGVVCADELVGVVGPVVDDRPGVVSVKTNINAIQSLKIEYHTVGNTWWQPLLSYGK